MPDTHNEERRWCGNQRRIHHQHTAEKRAARDGTPDAATIALPLMNVNASAEIW